MRFVRVAALGLLGACLVMPAVAMGQTRVTLGPLGGLSLAKFHGADAGTQQTRTGFAAGGFAEVELQRNFAIEFQALYVQKGAKATESGITATFKLDYIEVPVLAKVKYVPEGTVRLSPYFFAGPALGLRAKCALKGSSGGTSVQVSCGDAGIDLKSVDFSAVFGAGVDIGAVTIQGRYDLGLIKLESGSSPSDVKSSAWVVTVGWRVPMRK